MSVLTVTGPARLPEAALADTLEVDGFLAPAPSTSTTAAAVTAPGTAAERRHDAIRDLYAEHHGWLLGWLRGRLACTHHASDVAHDAFANVLEMTHWPVLREPRAFLRVVASRLLINRHHRQRIEAEALRTVAILAEADRGRSVEDEVALRQLLREVLVLLLEELDGRCGQAFLLARVDGWSYRKIALHLGVSESRVKQYLAQALVHCHARLAAAAGAAA